MNEKQLLISNALDRLGFIIDPDSAHDDPRYEITSDIVTLLNGAAGKSIVVHKDGEVRIEEGSATVPDN